MAEDKNTEDLDIVMDGMPGADQKTTEDVEPFQVDLNFGDETPTEDAEESEEEEVEFPAEEEVIEVEEETTDEVEEEEQDSEDEVTAEEETPDAEQEAAEEIVDELVETEEEPEKPIEPPKSPMVPKSRLDEVLAKNKKMQKQLDDIQQKEAEVQAEAPQYDFDVKEQEYQQLILDGDSTSAVALRTEMRAAEKEQMMFEVQQQMGQTVQQSQAAQELQEKAKEIEATFSILNENHEDFDKEITTEVLELRDAFIVQGYEPADSLARATEYTLAAKHPELLNGIEDFTTKQNKKVIQKRQKTTVKKKLEASKSQPPKLQGEGTAKRGEKVTDLNVLSDEEFGALPEETLKRMRGDFG
jgi:hypothetical protein